VRWQNVLFSAVYLSTLLNVLACYNKSANAKVCISSYAPSVFLVLLNRGMKPNGKPTVSHSVSYLYSATGYFLRRLWRIHSIRIGYSGTYSFCQHILTIWIGMDSSVSTVEPGYLHIITSDFDARPMSYVEGGVRSGYEPELARMLCQKLGLEPIWHNTPMAEFYTQIQTGKFDVIWFNQAIIPERQEWVDFTRPYGLFDEAVLVKAESSVRSPADLSGLRVGGLADSTNIALAATFPGVTTVPYPGSDKVLPEMLEALRKGEIDALIDDELVLVVAAEEDANLRIGFDVPTRVPFGIGVQKGNAGLHQAIESTLNQLIAEGTVTKLWEQWIPWKPFPFAHEVDENLQKV